MISWLQIEFTGDDNMDRIACISMHKDKMTNMAQRTGNTNITNITVWPSADHLYFLFPREVRSFSIWLYSHASFNIHENLFWDNFHYQNFNNFILNLEKNSIHLPLTLLSSFVLIWIYIYPFNFQHAWLNII